PASPAKEKGEEEASEEQFLDDARDNGEGEERFAEVHQGGFSEKREISVDSARGKARQLPDDANQQVIRPGEAEDLQQSEARTQERIGSPVGGINHDVAEYRVVAILK
ncbi:MAG: hypothetical protein ACKVIW_08325, partial [bacterium]